jgi:tRNA(His) 5'-end guanylyltransferase
MNADEFEGRMRALEVFHSLRFPPGAYVILRLDGRGFSGLTEGRFEKPFDSRFHDWMVEAARAVLDEFAGVYAYTESDEISVLFPRTWDLYDRELEKAVSLSAGLASAAFSLAAAVRVQFDSRGVLCADDSQVEDYFRWRQADAARCALNGWCYWTLRKEGRSAADATAELVGKSADFKNELLFRRGINFNEVPQWQRRGTGLYWESFEHAGYNPKRAVEVVTTRRRIKVDRELPTGEGYSSFLRSFLQPPTRRVGKEG